MSNFCKINSEIRSCWSAHLPAQRSALGNHLKASIVGALFAQGMFDGWKQAAETLMLIDLYMHDDFSKLTFISIQC